VPTSNGGGYGGEEHSRGTGLPPGLRSAACSGPCAAGYFCPPGSTSPTEVPCGGDGVYCPPAVGRPVPTKPGFFTVGGANATVRTDQRPCEPGSFCVEGIKFDCPGGSFGSKPRLATARCSGLCYKGHYCPPGSVSPTRRFPAPRVASERPRGSRRWRARAPASVRTSAARAPQTSSRTASLAERRENILLAL